VGIHFDGLCNSVDQLTGPQRHRVSIARLFEIDQRGYEEFLSDDSVQVEYIKERFGMPFPVVAVEDTHSVVVLSCEKGEAQHDLTAEKKVICFQTSSIGSFLISGQFSTIYSEGLWAMALHQPLQIAVRIPSAGWKKLEGLGQDANAMREGFRLHTTVALEQLMLIADPRKVILEKAPLFRGVASERYKKTKNRPTYTAVTPGAARQKIGHLQREDGGGKHMEERRAHWRCAHTRTLTSEKWGESRGKVVAVERAWIPAIWNGARYGTDGAHVYRVILGDEDK